jgi:hypothetical protein
MRSARALATFAPLSKSLTKVAKMSSNTFLCRRNLIPGTQLLGASVVVGILVTLTSTLRAAATLPLYNSTFDSLTLDLQMGVYVDDPWGSSYGMSATVTESTDPTHPLSTIPFAYKKGLYTDSSNRTYFFNEVTVLNGGIYGWREIPYNAFANASVSGMVYEDGSGIIRTHTFASASPGGNFFPNWPAVAQVSGRVALNGSPGEGNLRVATSYRVLQPPAGRIPGGSGASSLSVDGVRVTKPFEVVDVDSNLTVSFTNDSFLHKYLDFDPTGIRLGISETFSSTIYWGFDQLPGESPSIPMIGIMDSVIFPNQEVFTCLEGLNETFFISSGSLQEDAGLRSSMVMKSQKEMNEALFQVIEGGPGFASLRLPDVLEPTAYTITIGVQEYAWDGTTSFDFLTINPQGVERFRIAGPGFGSFAEMPLFSTKFAEAGTVDFTVAIPEIPSALLAIIPMGLFLYARLWQKR